MKPDQYTKGRIYRSIQSRKKVLCKQTNFSSFKVNPEAIIIQQNNTRTPFHQLFTPQSRKTKRKHKVVKRTKACLTKTNDRHENFKITRHTNTKIYCLHIIYPYIIEASQSHTAYYIVLQKEQTKLVKPSNNITLKIN